LLISVILLTIISLLAVSAIVLCVIDWLTANLYLRKLIIVIGLTCVIEAAVAALFLFYQVAFNYHIFYIIANINWIDTGLFTVSFGLLLDSLTVTMLIVVVPTSALIHCYSMNYMSSDRNITRFIGYLSFFTLMMVILVSSSNFILMFFGWEGIGLASYLLINFWYTRRQANKSSLKAVIINRIGDLFLILAISIIYTIYGSVDYITVFGLNFHLIHLTLGTFFNFSINWLDLITIFLLIAAMAKSAQVGLHTWLPDAMEGPTPVSALIHAATLVTAGVFILVRCSPLIELSLITRNIMIIIGAITSFYAACVAGSQNDLKRVIAFSTCSQLGYMFAIVGCSNYGLAIFHLMNHAYFKALLFLSAGSVIHALNGQQDLRRMGGLLNLLPLTHICILIASIALMGLPFTSAFYSKHLIIEMILCFPNILSIGSFVLLLSAAVLTALYSIRSLYLTFYIDSNVLASKFESVYEAPLPMSIAMVVLSFMTIFIAYIVKDLFVRSGTDFLDGSVFVDTQNYIVLDAELIDWIIKIIISSVSLFGVGILIIYYLFYKVSIFVLIYNRLINFTRLIFKFSNRKWYFDFIYNEIFLLGLAKFSLSIALTILEYHVLYYFGPGGLRRIIQSLSQFIADLQNGSIDAYMRVFQITYCLFILVVFKNPFLILLIPPYYLFVYICFNSGWYLWEKLKELTRWIVGKLGFQ